jgi:hypothetical protein
MKSLTRNVCLPICLLLCGIAWLGLNSAPVFGQEEAASEQEVHNAPETITGTFEGNEADLLSAWRLLSDLAVRLFSGNEAELLSGNEAELLSGNSPELLSGNEPELLSGNETSFLSENDPELFSGNKVVLFSNNTLQIHLIESGNNNNAPAQGALAGGLSALSKARWATQLEQIKRQEAKLVAQAKAVESRAKAAIEQEKAQAKNLADELSLLRAQVQQLEARNADLQAKVAELQQVKR